MVVSVATCIVLISDIISFEVIRTLRNFGNLSSDMRLSLRQRRKTKLALFIMKASITAYSMLALVSVVHIVLAVLTNQDPITQASFIHVIVALFSYVDPIIFFAKEIKMSQCARGNRVNVLQLQNQGFHSDIQDLPTEERSSYRMRQRAVRFQIDDSCVSVISSQTY